MASISIRNVSKSFGAASVLRSVSLDIRHGEFVSLLGPSGCGKSTLLRILAGLEELDGGEVRIGDLAVDRQRPRERDVAMVFQSYALYPHLTAYDNIAAPLRMRRLSVVERMPFLGRLLPSRRDKERAFAAEIAEVGELLRLGGLLARKPAQLSGGQRQRVALARAIVRHPKAFLMDEPLSSLDLQLRETTRAEIVALHRRLAATFIYVTHDQSEAMTMSDRVAVMMGGELLQVGSPAEVYDNPSQLAVARFIGSPVINTLAGQVRADGQVEAAGTLFPLRLGRPAATAVTVAFRAQRCSVVDAPGQGTIAGRITHLENLGPDLLVHLVHEPSGQAMIVRTNADAASARRIGATAQVRPAPAGLLCFDATGASLSPDRQLRVA